MDGLAVKESADKSGGIAAELESGEINPGGPTVVFVPDVSYLLDGEFQQQNFDLEITNPNGEVFIVEDYFSYLEPP